jgi:hypothetical protein
MSHVHARSMVYPFRTSTLYVKGWRRDQPSIFGLGVKTLKSKHGERIHVCSELGLIWVFGLIAFQGLMKGPLQLILGFAFSNDLGPKLIFDFLHHREGGAKYDNVDLLRKMQKRLSELTHMFSHQLFIITGDFDQEQTPERWIVEFAASIDFGAVVTVIIMGNRETE